MGGGQCPRTSSLHVMAFIWIRKCWLLLFNVRSGHQSVLVLLILRHKSYVNRGTFIVFLNSCFWTYPIRLSVPLCSNFSCHFVQPHQNERCTQIIANAKRFIHNDRPPRSGCIVIVRAHFYSSVSWRLSFGFLFNNFCSRPPKTPISTLSWHAV